MIEFLKNVKLLMKYEIGKTTIMNILCGISEQTSGEIKIYDYDTRDHMDYLRQLISYCPQRM
jgi:ABC-type multidrug transport system ATPase subunit